MVLYDTKIQNPLKDNYVPAIEELGFHLPHVIILSSTECGQTISDVFDSRHKFSDVKVINYYFGKFGEESSVQIHPHHWGRGCQLSMIFFGANKYKTIDGVKLHLHRHHFLSPHWK